MDDNLILNPFNDYRDVTSIAKTLALFIKSEAEYGQSNIEQFNELGGDNADGENFYRAQYCKAEAEKAHYTLRTLERFAKFFADKLTPEAREVIRNFLDFIDNNNNDNNRKAG